MATIDELMKGKEPGSIKIRGEEWLPHHYFQPYFKTEDGLWYGLTQQGKQNDYSSALSVRWQLWTPPEETVEVFEWMYRRPGEQQWYISATVMTEREAQDDFIKRFQYRKTGRSWKVPK